MTEMEMTLHSVGLGTILPKGGLIEAMIMGLPFVASDIPPIPETVGGSYSLYSALDLDVLSGAIGAKYLAREGPDLGLKKTMVERFDYRVRFEEFYRVRSL